MIIQSSDNKKFIDVGSEIIWDALISTVFVRLDYFKDQIPLAMQFLQAKQCAAEHALDTAIQFNLIRDELSKFKPTEVLFDRFDHNKKAPWGDQISKVITSIAHYFVTADGKNLLNEIVSILCYADILQLDVSSS